MQRFYTRLVVGLCFLLCLGAPAAAQATTNEVLSWQPSREVAAYQGKKLTWDEKVRLSLIVSGARKSDIQHYENRFRAILAEARIATAGLDQAATADQLLQFLHKGIFKSYNFYQTRIDVLLDTGVFNCVSSAVVYDLLAEALGLQTGAVSTTDHAFCTVTIGDRTVDVETTTPLGFDPGHRREFHDAFGKLTGFAYVPPRNYADRTKLNDRELLGLILQNRMTEAQQQGDDVSPVRLAWDLWSLEGTEHAKKLLYQSYSNYLAYLNNSHRYLSGLEVIARLESLLGRNPLTDSLAAAFAQNLIVDRISKADYTGARSAVRNWSRWTDRSASEWYSLIVRSEAQKMYKKAGWTATTAWLAAVSDVTAAEKRSLLTSLALQEAQSRMAGGNSDAGYRFWQSLPPDLKSQPDIKRLKETLVYNLAVGFHNRFANLMNQGKTAEGEAILKEGLAKFPDSSILRSDKEQLARFLQRTGGS